MKVIKWLVIVFSIALMGTMIISIIPAAAGKIATMLKIDAIKFDRWFNIISKGSMTGTLVTLGVASLAFPLIGVPLLIVGIIQGYYTVKFIQNTSMSTNANTK